MFVHPSISGKIKIQGDGRKFLDRLKVISFRNFRPSPWILHCIQLPTQASFSQCPIRGIQYYPHVTECIVCVQDHDPLTFSFLSSFLFFDWVGILWPQLSKVVRELCESRGGRPGLCILTCLLVSVDVKQYCTILRHWSQLVPNMSTDIRGH